MKLPMIGNSVISNSDVSSHSH